MDDYNRALKERILEQARRIKELEFLLEKKSKKPKSKVIKSIKSKQERRRIIKQRRIRNRNTVKLVQSNFWLINPSDNIKKIYEEIDHIHHEKLN